jgi:tryptophan synthase alpha chain
LPIAVGFGISTPDQAAAVVKVADAAVVGSAIIKRIAENLDQSGHAKSDLVKNTLALVEDLSASVRAARR